jgi:selenocysteine lyase/cysteine desulfurase
MGIDAAACSGYKWLFGPHGAAFLFVAAEHQGRTLPDFLVPGHARHNYRPWVESPEPGEALLIDPGADARRYEPGHHGYLGFCALYEGLGFVQQVGVARAQGHATRLAQRLKASVDPARYPCLSPHVDRSPILTLRVADGPRRDAALRAAGIVVALSGTQLRVSPAIYNTEDEIDRLAEVLNAR